MPATAAAILEHVSPPASIRNLPQFMEQHLSGGTRAAAETTDPTPASTMMSAGMANDERRRTRCSSGKRPGRSKK